MLRVLCPICVSNSTTSLSNRLVSRPLELHEHHPPKQSPPFQNMDKLLCFVRLVISVIVPVGFETLVIRYD